MVWFSLLYSPLSNLNPAGLLQYFPDFTDIEIYRGPKIWQAKSQFREKEKQPKNLILSPLQKKPPTTEKPKNKTNQTQTNNNKKNPHQSHQSPSEQAYFSNMHPQESQFLNQV